MTLMVIWPQSVEWVAIETPRPYQLGENRPVALIDPGTYPNWRLGEGTFTNTGTLLRVDLGHEPSGKIWNLKWGQEDLGERVRLTLRVREEGEWQVVVRLDLPKIVEELEYPGRPTGRFRQEVFTYWLGILGWSTRSRTVWTDYETARMCYLELEGQQCGGAFPCTVRFPYDPYRYTVRVPPDLPGRPLRDRPTTFCSMYELVGTCTEQGKTEAPSPEEQQEYEREYFEQLERERRLSPTPSPQGAPTDWLEVRGTVRFRDPLTNELRPARGVRVELWHKAPRSCNPWPGRPAGRRENRAIPPRCRDQPLARAYTEATGDYRLVVIPRFPVRPVLRIYATDDRRVAVRRSLSDLSRPTEMKFGHKLGHGVPRPSLEGRQSTGRDDRASISVTRGDGQGISSDPAQKLDHCKDG